MLAACGTAGGDGAVDSGTTQFVPPSDLPDTYAFASRFSDEDSVAYSGQAMRQVLIADLALHMASLNDRVESGWMPTSGDVEAELNFYFDFDGVTSGAVPISSQTQPAALQTTYGDVSTSANLVGKLAGNDPVGQHRDWTTGFDGFPVDGAVSPEDWVRHWFAVLDAQAVGRASGLEQAGPDGVVLPVHLTSEGVDVERLVTTFLYGAIGFSQTADDYLDDDEAGKGLLSDHTAADDGAPYTALEHAWDEGFGYFGGSRNFGTIGAEALVTTAFSDALPQDGAIDLTSEVSWPLAVQAAHRDVDAASSEGLVEAAWSAFVEGRLLLAESEGPLSAAEQEALQQSRDRAVAAYEAVFAASVIHHLNGVLAEMQRIDTADHRHAELCAQWSSMKGLALAPQFNPRSPMSDADFQTLHALLGMAPKGGDTDPSERDAYAAQLVDARALLASIYGFDEANLGEGDGTNGW